MNKFQHVMGVSGSSLNCVNFDLKKHVMNSMLITLNRTLSVVLWSMFCNHTDNDDLDKSLLVIT